MKQGKEKHFCPFYVERMKIKKANCDLIFMPYNYIFLKEIRESMDINLKKAILVKIEIQKLSKFRGSGQREGRDTEFYGILVFHLV